MSLNEQVITNNISNTIHDLVNQFSAMRRISHKMVISTNAVELLQTDKNFESGWVAYDAERPQTSLPSVNKIKISCHELYAQPMIAQKILDDSIVNIEKWISSSIYTSFIDKEEQAFLFGSGANMPSGVVSCSKDANTLTDEITYDSLMNLINILPHNMLGKAKMMMHRETLYQIQKIKDVNMQNIYQSHISNEIPESILGIPVICNNNLPSYSKSKDDKPLIILGDFSSGYLIVDRQAIDIIQDPYTSKPFVKFYAVKRVGGGVINPSAFAFFKLKK